MTGQATIKTLTASLRADLIKHHGNIPEELKTLPAWVVWRITKTDPRTGKFDKVPAYATTGANRHGQQGSPDDRAHLVTFDKAMTALEDGTHYAGVGIAMLPDWGITALDFDHCVADGFPAPEVLSEVDNTYAEFSPSGTGVRAFMLGAVTDGKNHEAGFELFSGKGFVTLTGQRINNAHSELGMPLQRVDTAIRAKLEAMANAKPQFPGSIAADDWAACIRNTDPETPENVERVQSALAHVSAASGRDAWRNVGFALLSTHWDCAENLFRTWSMTAPQRFSEEGFRNIVESAKDKPNGITLGTLFAMAAANGWDDPRKVGRSIETYGDISNGRRFAEHFRGRLLYCHGNGAWYQWDAQRWERCENGEPIAAAKLIAEDCFNEASGALRKESSDWAKRNFSQALAVHRSASRLENMLKCACSEAGMSIANPGLFDADPWKLAVRNGVLDLRTGTLIDATSDMLISRQAGTHYDFQAECPRWRQFLAEVCSGDGDMAAFLQRVCGYALTGSVTEEKLFFMYGTGANGKSVFANIVAAVFGEYAVTVRAALLARDPRGTGSDAEREKARLPGSRLALVNETGQSDLWDDQKVKEITSRERISARYLHQESFDFMPTHKLFIRGNHQPGAMDTSDGFWRRMVLIGFTRQFSESERVPDLDSRIIETELPGVLGWMVEGCIRWQREGLRVPAGMRAAVEAYRRDTDLLGEWLRLHCTISPQAETPVSGLFHSYERFLRDGNMKAPSRSAFGRQLVSRGYRRRESNSQSLYSGLALRESVVWGIDDDEL